MAPFSKYPLQVFFDGRCAICTRAIQKSGQADKFGRLTFIDISAPDFKPLPHGFTIEDAQRELHVIDAAGKKYTGVDGVMEFRLAVGVGTVEAIFWRVSRWPVLHGLYAAGYALLATHRHRVSQACRL